MPLRSKAAQWQPLLFPRLPGPGTGKHFPLAVLAAVLAATLASCTAWKRVENPAWKSATGAEQYERLLIEAVAKQNWMELERHLAATFVAATPSGVQSRAEALAEARQLSIQDFSLRDARSVPNGNDLVLTFTLSVRGSYRGQPLPSYPWRVMTVWQTTAHGWIAVAQAIFPLPSGR